MFPEIASRISFSVGFKFLSSKALAVRIMPGNRSRTVSHSADEPAGPMEHPSRASPL
jgi:hypothetical protein